MTSITSKEYGSVKYTKANKTEWYSGNVEFNISAKDSTDDNYHTGIKSVTATFNGTDVSEKLKGLPVFTAEKVESVNDITFNTEGLNLNEGTNTVEVTVVNNSGVSSNETYEVYVDTIKPEVSQFKFETVKSDVDKILSFLTFGIYNNEKIQVTVSAYDVNNAENAKSGIDYLEENHAEIQLYSVANQDKITAGDYNYKDGILSRTFTLDCRENEFKQYMLTAKAWDNVHNVSASYTFEKPDKAEDLYSKGLKAKQSDSADTEVVTNTIAPIVTEIKSNAYGESSVKYTDDGKEWYSGDIQFSISAKDSTDDKYHTGIKKVTATFNGTDVSEKLKGLPVFTAEKVESVNDITFNTEGLNLNEGTNTVEVTVVNNSGVSSNETYEVYVDTIKPEVSQFKFETVKSDVDKILSFLTFGIYNNEKIQVTVSAYDVNNAENAKSGIDYLEENHAEIELYNGKEKIAADDNSYSYDENGVLSRTFTLACGETEFKQYMLTAKAWDNVHNMSASYTFEKTDKAEDLYSKGLKAKQSDSADTEVVTNTIAPIVTSITSKEYGSVKYTKANKTEWYSGNVEFNISAKDSTDDNYHTGIKSVTATFNGTDVSEKLKGLPVFTAEKVESVNDITFNTEGLNLNEGTNTVEVTVVNNSGVSSNETYEVYVDTIKPEVSQFKFETVKSDVDKILSFLTFGIYNNEKIQVTVSAYDVNNAENAKSGIDYLEENHAEIQLYSVANQDKITAGDYNYKDGILSRTFTLDCRENEFKQYMLTAKAWDNVHNVSASYTFEKPDKAEDLYSKGLKAKQSDSADTEVVTNTIAPIVTEIKSNAYGESSVKYTDDGKEWYSGDIQFSISAKDSTDDKYHTGIKKVTATFNGTDVSEKLKGLPVFTAEKVESVNDITFNTEGLNLNEGTNTVEVTVVNNSGVSSNETYEVYVDTIKPEVSQFKFETVKSDVDKILSFLTFGIYNNEKIQVTVSAYDVNNAENAKSGIDYLEENHAEIELYNGKEKIAADDNSYSYDENGVLSRTFTLACGETEFKQYMLTAKAWDNVHNMSASYTFEKTDKAEDLYSKGLKAKQSDSADTEVVTNTIAPIVTEIKSNAYGESSVKYTDDGKEWYSGDIQFSISAKDSTDDKYHTGIKKVTATFNGTDVSEKLKGLPVFTAEKVESVNDITFNTEGLNLNEGTNTVEVTVVNNSGVSSNETYEVYVDTIKPEVSQFKFETVKSDVDKILSFLTFGIYNNEKIQVTVSAYDVNNAENAKSGIDYLEENHAEIQLYSVANQDKITAGDYNYKDGILSRTFTLDCRENEFKQYMLTAKAWDNVHNVSASYTFEKPDKAEDLYSKGLKAKQSDSADTEVVTNTIAPIVTSITSNAYGDDSVKYTDSENREWYSNNIQFNISADDSEVANHHTGIKSVTATFNGTDVSEKLKGLPTFTDKKFESVSDITFNTEGMTLKDGENKVEVTVVNNSGVSSTKEYIVYVDTTAPKITSFTIKNNSQNPIVDETSSQKYSYYFQTDTQVTVNADDNAEDKGNYSGIKTIYFRAYDVVTGEEYKSSKNVSTDNATASATFTVKANFKGELYAYAVDNVDNNGKTQHGEKKPDDLIVETQQHHNGNASVTMSRTKASYKDNSGLDLYSGNVNARVVFEDAYAGIKDATITVYDYKNDVTGTIYAEIGNDGSIKKTEVTGSVNNIIFNDDYTTSKDNLLPKLVIDYVVTDNSNNIKITTSMTDRAGNKTDNVKDSLSIDKTKPVIDVKYDNNEHTTYGGNDYYKADRTATVTVTERNFDESLVEAAIMRNGGRYTTIGGWTHNNNTADPDKSTHVAKIVYNTDGDFTFDIAVKDKAMNSADKFTQQKFTVDKTAPVIDVSFDNNSAKNGNYYKADRTATIKITEHNFNSGSQYVNIPVTAEGATAPSVVGWSGSGDDHNATVSFNKDGKYSFTVDYTDLAGNKAVQKKVDSFYIDKTAPEVEITGVADHQAYNGTVAPVVTYRDDNFADDHDFRFTKIDINGKSDDTSKFDYDTGDNGVTEFIYKYRDFAEVLENDGIYNFTVELSDKAGNSTSKSVTFSVNRFGSTFKASDESKKLINNGYTNAEQDIVIEEINVTPLTKHSVTLAKSGGNSTELVENTDYTFTSSNNGNEWCKSVYTVNKKNFSDEAAYTVTIMSVDKAKNTNNNRMADSSLSTEQKNKRECAISFVVDKTSPLVSITGIKDNELYKEASKKVKIVCEDDNLDKSKLVVTLDNKKLAEGKDYTIVDDKDGSIAGMLTAEIVLKAETGGIKENLKVTIGDLAGNTGEKSVDNFILSANIFQRFFANPVLVICTFAGLALVIAAVIFFVAKKRKKAE